MKANLSLFHAAHRTQAHHMQLQHNGTFSKCSFVLFHINSWMKLLLQFVHPHVLCVCTLHVSPPRPHHKIVDKLKKHPHPCPPSACIAIAIYHATNKDEKQPNNKYKQHVHIIGSVIHPTNIFVTHVVSIHPHVITSHHSNKSQSMPNP